MGISRIISRGGGAYTPQWKRLEIDFRKHGELYGGIAHKVGVPKTTVYDICTTFKKHGTVKPLRKTGRPSSWTQKDVYKVSKWIKADPDITAKELIQKFNKSGSSFFLGEISYPTFY